MARMTAVKMTRRRSSGTRHAFASQENTASYARRRRLGGVRLNFFCLGIGRRLLRLVRLRLGLLRSPAALLVLRPARLRLAQDGEGPARRLDLLAGGGGRGVNRNRQGLRELADAEQLHVLADASDEAL